MSRNSLRSLPQLLRWRMLTSGLGAVCLPFLGLGCLQPMSMLPPFQSPVVQVQSAPARPMSPYAAVVPQPAERTVNPPPPPIQRVQAIEVIKEPAAKPAPAEEKSVKRLPITLDTVLRLAEEQNRQVALARERLNEACAEKNIAAMSWIPNLYVGTSYFRHEGGIQAVNGAFVDSSFGALFSGLELQGRFDVREAAFVKISAERKVWQQKGELSKVTSETLLEAANTYIDMLLARSSVVVAKKMEKHEADLLKRAQGLAKADPGTEVQVKAIEAEVLGHQQAIAKVEQQADAAAKKLAYLLGLDPCIELVPVDPGLMPFELVDADLSTCQLVAMALEGGPGVMELQRLLAVVQGGIEKMRSPAMMMPIIEMRMAEGAFNAGPGSSFGGDNRWDLNLQARFPISGLFAARDRQRVAQSKLEQVHLTYQDLRGKLSAGVQEAHEAIVSGRVQMRLGNQQTNSAQEAFDLSHERLRKNVPGSSINEVLQTIRLLELASLNQLATISSYDKAQLRLMIFLGPAYGSQSAAPSGECRLPNLPDKK